MTTHKKSSLLVTGLICALIGATLGYSLSSWTSENEDSSRIEGDERERDPEHGFTFISPLLECEKRSESANRKYIPFEKKLKEDILRYQKERFPDTHLSFYYRDMQNGPWFSNNYDERFYPASLLKIPILIGYVRWAEMDPSILQSEIVIEDLVSFDQKYPPKKYAKIGDSYKVEELLNLMILYSDNNASSNLLLHLPENITNEVFSTFGIPSPENHTVNTYKITVKEYASFFRILYNASYLSSAGSEATLKLLSQVDFDRGITGKLPQDIVVAHKFGERGYTETDASGKEKELAQLHDCGIVYCPGNPYLLCMMTRGDSMDDLSTMTQDISKMIYDAVDETRKKAVSAQ